MTEHEYFEFHLKTVWKVYQKLNAELYTHKENGSVYEQIYSNDKGGFKIIESYEEFYEAIIKQKNRYFIDNDYFQIKSSLFQTLRNFSKHEFLKEFIDEIIFNSPEDYSGVFIENRFKYPMSPGTSEYLRHLLPKMSYENALCYFTQVKTWNEMNEIITSKFPLITDHAHGKEFLFIGLKNCFSEDKYHMRHHAYNSIVKFLLEKYSNKDLKTFDFLPDIESFLSSQDRPKNIVINEDEEFFTTRISIDCQHAMNIYPVKNGIVGNYLYLVDKLSEYLVKDTSNNILDINTIHKYDKDDNERDTDYKISEVFVDTLEHNPKLKLRLSYLFNKYIKNSIEAVNSKDSDFDFEQFTANWLLQENLQNDLSTNQDSKTKVKKI